MALTTEAETSTTLMDLPVLVFIKSYWHSCLLWAPMPFNEKKLSSWIIKFFFRCRWRHKSEKIGSAWKLFDWRNKKAPFFSFLNQICPKTNFLGAGDKDGKKFGCCLFICLRYKLIQCHTIQYDTAWLDNILSSLFFLLAGLFIFWFKN